jgi:hypothetical protein
LEPRCFSVVYRWNCRLYNPALALKQAEPGLIAKLGLGEALSRRPQSGGTKGL